MAKITAKPRASKKSPKKVCKKLNVVTLFSVDDIDAAYHLIIILFLHENVTSNHIMNIRMNKTRKTQWQLLQQLPSNKKTNNTSKRYKKTRIVFSVTYNLKLYVLFYEIINHILKVQKSCWIRLTL